MLNLVSFTGADNNTNVDELAKFVEGYNGSPIAVELALLYFPNKEGSARNPDAKQRDAILSAIPKKNVAAHLCGVDVFKRILADDQLLIDDLKRYNRVQLNINARRRDFTPKEVFTVYANLWKNEIPMILQYNDDSRDDIEHFVYHPAVYSSVFTRPDILFDASRGMGITTSEYPRAMPGMVCGYAGGLNPQNIAEAKAKLDIRYNAHNAIYYTDEGRPYWLDMESGVRTNNEFDLDLCRKVMDAVSV